MLRNAPSDHQALPMPGPIFPGQHMNTHAITRHALSHWANMQERRVRVVGIPRGCWTKDIYQALSAFGTVVQIGMGPGRACAWVVFQPPPQENVYEHPIRMGKVYVRVEQANSRPFFVDSPVDPARKYQQSNIFYGNSIDFGTTTDENTMSIMNTARGTQGVRMTLNVGDRKELDIQFPLVIDNEMRRLRFLLPLSLLGKIYRVHDMGTSQSTLIIPFDSPPKFYMQLKEQFIHQSCSNYFKSWSEWFSWYRQTDVVDGATGNRLKMLPVMNHKHTALIDIGRWTTYRLSFDSLALEGSKYEEFCAALADFNVIVESLAEYTLVRGATPQLWSLLEEEISGTHPHLERSAAQVSSVNKIAAELTTLSFPSSSKGSMAAQDSFKLPSSLNELATGQISLTFPVRYQLEACLSNGYLKEHTISRNFLERLAAETPNEAVQILEKVTDRQHVFLDPMEIFGIRMKVNTTRKFPSYCTLARSANVTPTMIHVGTPVVETSNRIIRKHLADADRFIRVKFTDEKTEGQIRSQDNERSNAIFDRISRAMTEGIVIAGRYYEFLAFGNSQFREHGAYFYAPTASKSAEDIRRSMGNFDHIRTVAKFGARLGQCFSTTRAIKTINVKIERIPDIERNGYNFTDGVGKISRLLATMAAQELGLRNAFEDPPSLFQFRLGGCKGVLALDPKITGNVVCIRPSQHKFEAPNVGLEIIRASAPAVACFNRQLIMVLSSLGVKDAMFLRKQQEMVNYLEKATKDETTALEKLQRNIDLNQTTLTMVGMILDGFMKSREPFMMSLLQLWRAYNIKHLKEKARIVIDDGAFVLGCVDESATLRGHYEDPQCRLDATREEKLATLPEIFLQVSDPYNKGHYKVIQGICILARNPSLHPGDIRVVRAVDVACLRHLRNVVVLPQTGDRDLASMCSGGDLDGDDYIVLWDRDFIPKFINEPPMDFTPERPVEKGSPITVKDMTDFFVTYMKNDTLKPIATAHLAQADFNEEGVRDEKCLELARLHSQAVDYPKTGIPAMMTRDLKPRKRPHFQVSKDFPKHKVYKSTKVLGVLFDQVQLVDFKPQYQNAFDPRILNAFKLDEDTLKKAGEIKESYDSALRRLMAKHAIYTEFEAWSVFILSHNLESSDYTFAEEFGRTIGLLKEKFRHLCREAAGATSSGDFRHMGPFVAAMYTVTAYEMDAALKECHESKVVGGRMIPVRKIVPENMPLVSFPWLFVGELGKICAGSMAVHNG